MNNLDPRRDDSTAMDINAAGQVAGQLLFVPGDCTPDHAFLNYAAPPMIGRRLWSTVGTPRRDDTSLRTADASTTPGKWPANPT